MTKTLLASIALTLGAFELAKRHAAAVGPDEHAASIRDRVSPELERALREKGLELGAPVFIRIFKEERQLEVWLAREPERRFVLFRSYPICAMSGKLGPKQAEGDRQAPEGCYFVPRSRMRPDSKYHLGFDLGYPNAFDRSHGRTGSLLLVHGACVSAGCFAMTDPFIEEIYTLADAALEGGQDFFRVHSFPFRMTPARMAKAEREESEWLSFWKNLKTCYDWFEKRQIPPDAVVSGGEYRFGEAG